MTTSRPRPFEVGRQSEALSSSSSSASSTSSLSHFSEELHQPYLLRSASLAKRSRSEILEELLLNDSLLLLKCSDYQWRDVLAICRILKEILQQTSRSEYRLIQAATSQLLATDSFGNTPLHMAVHFKPPHSVIAVMLEASNAAKMNELHLHLIQNNKGAVPLSIACGTGASVSVLQLLLRQPYGGSTVSMVDKHGCTPFHGLVRRYEMLRKVRIHHATSLPLQRLRAIVKNESRDDDSSSTLTLARSNDLSSNAILLESPLLKDVDTWYHSINQEKESSSQPLLEKFCQKVSLLLRAAWKEEYPAEIMPSLLHAAAVVPESLPCELTDLLIRCHDFENRTGLHDNSIRRNRFTVVRSPLEVAILSSRHLRPFADDCSSSPSLDDDSDQYHSRTTRQQSYFFDQILKADPMSAALPSPVTGRLPLVDAVASQFFWNESFHGNHNTGDDSVMKDGSFSTASEGLLQALFRACPQALMDRDPVSGLPVPALANRCDINTIFQLLRRSPTSIL